LKDVLVVDDDPDLLAVVSLALTGLGGYSVHTCDSPMDAAERARLFSPDLVLLDVMMAGLDGFGVLKALRDAEETRAIPVVFMSAQADRARIAAYEPLGCLGMIAKPFDPLRLPDILEDLWLLHAQRRVEAHHREFELLRTAYRQELGEKIAAMRAGAAALAAEGWDISLVQSIAQLAHRIAGSSGLYRYSSLSRSAAALEEIVNRLLRGARWPPPSSPAELVRLVEAVAHTARTETLAAPAIASVTPAAPARPESTTPEAPPVPLEPPDEPAKRPPA
jgi:CheY-like chemotaxis protein